ncbi:MAG: hypothetical protein LBQ31_03160, partial [Bacteroidales bacterium]|nr:hypothetical protein [Bacteroidales bacterium]
LTSENIRIVTRNQEGSPIRRQPPFPTVRSALTHYISPAHLPQGRAIRSNLLPQTKANFSPNKTPATQNPP